MMAFPSVQKEREKLPRQYIINVIYTLRGLHFKDWVNQRVDARHESCVEKKELNIIMDPAIAAIYR